MGYTEIDPELERRLLVGYSRYGTSAADQQQIVEQVMSILLANRMLEFVRSGTVAITGVNAQGEIQFGMIEGSFDRVENEGERALTPHELMQLEEAVRSVVRNLSQQ